jgi:prevent-host-death family protein
MGALPVLVPISELRTRQAEILAALEDGPILLTQHSKAAAVLLSTEHYNRLAAMIEDLQDALDAAEARRNAEPVIDLDEYLAGRGGHGVSSKAEQSSGKRP